MFDKSFSQAPAGHEDEALLPGADIEIEIEADAPDEGLGEDGSITVILPAFDDNLAELLDDQVLAAISEDLMQYYSDDREARAEWEDTYRDGLDLLGLKIEERTEPWAGACGVVHPILSEAVVKFQSECIMETMPPGGCVKTKIIGKQDRETEQTAERVRDDMNYWLLERMSDYRTEHERLLWNLPIAGCAIKKVYYDPYNGRPVAQFVAAEDFIVPYGATDLSSAPRYAHFMRKTPHTRKKGRRSRHQFGAR